MHLVMMQVSLVPYSKQKAKAHDVFCKPKRMQLRAVAGAGASVEGALPKRIAEYYMDVTNEDHVCLCLHLS